MQAQTDIEKLKQALATIEAQRDLLGDQVVEAALAPLREKLAALQTGALGEQRKLVTVLFADLAGFTQFSARLDPEDVRELLNEYFAAWKTAITAQGGVVEKFIGDAVMAVFGLPAAHEDDPERVIRAALEMQARLAGLNVAFQRDHGINLAMRVGINTGEVVVSTLGERQGEAFVAVGETVNLSSRIQAAAPPGGILITYATYRHVRGVFNVSPQEPLRVKGVDQPLEVYLVKEAKPRAFRMARRGVEGVETRLVGRAGELKRLQDAFQEVLSTGERRAVTLVAEAGLGKSRLIDEFGHWLELLPEQLFYFKGRAHASLQNSPYGLVRDVFAFRFQIHDSDPPQVVREKLERGIGQGFGDPKAGQLRAHFIGRLLGFEFGQSEHLPAGQSDARGFHDQALVYLGDYFRTLAEAEPVVVLLEDLHWADDSSLDLINHLEGSLARRRLLILSAARPALFERRPGWGAGLPFHTRLDLRPLSKAESEQLVRDILQKVPQVPPALPDLVAASAEGNPFYIEELLKMLIEDGVIVKGEQHWRVEAHRLESMRVPPTLTGVLQARLDSLAPDERLPLQRAAVVGRTFWDRAVAYLEDRPAVERTPHNDATAALLDRLRRREMIFRREVSAFEDTREFIFKHALLRDVTYESLLKRQRRVYHGHAARWLEQVTEASRRSDEYAALIAEHYEQAGESLPAARWYQRAGMHAQARYATAEAAHAYSRALALIPPGDPAWRFELLRLRERVYNLQAARQAQAHDLQELASLAGQLGDAARQAAVALSQAEYAQATGDFPAALQAAQRAIDLAGAAQANDTAAEGHLLLAGALTRQGELDTAHQQALQALDLARQSGRPALEAKSLRQLGLIAYYTGDPQKAHTYFARTLDLFLATGDRQGEAMALNNLGGANFNMGEYGQAADYYRRSYELCREIGDRAGESRSLNNLGIISVVNAEYALAEEYYLQSYQISQEIGNRSGEVSTLDNLGNLAQYRYQFSQARRFQEESLRVAEEIGDQLAGSITLINLGRGSLYLGDFETSYPYLQTALEQLGQLGDQQGECHARVNLSYYFLETGDLAAALEQAGRALALSQEGSLPSEQAWSLTAQANALAASGRFAPAIAAYTQALEIRQELDEPRETTDDLAGLALAYLDAGQLQQARERVETILVDLEQHGLEGYDQPAQIFLACYRVLQAVGDPRAGTILDQGYRLLQEIAARIEAEPLRHSFFERVSANRALRAAWTEARG